MATRKGVGLPTIRKAKQLDFLMLRIRQELNVTDKWLKLRGPGKRFRYEIDCEECGRTHVEYAYAAMRLVVFHQLLGHNLNVRATERDRAEYENRNAAYPDTRRTGGNVPSNAPSKPRQGSRSRPASVGRIFLTVDEVPFGVLTDRLPDGTYRERPRAVPERPRVRRSIVTRVEGEDYPDN